ncbi:universal stress protein [Streptomyces coelicoflavus]
MPSSPPPSLFQPPRAAWVATSTVAPPRPTWQGLPGPQQGPSAPRAAAIHRVTNPRCSRLARTPARVVVDGSPSSYAALRRADRYARTVGGVVEAIHVWTATAAGALPGAREFVTVQWDTTARRAASPSDGSSGATTVKDGEAPGRPVVHRSRRSPRRPSARRHLADVFRSTANDQGPDDP